MSNGGPSSNEATLVNSAHRSKINGVETMKEMPELTSRVTPMQSLYKDKLPLVKSGHKWIMSGKTPPFNFVEKCLQSSKESSNSARKMSSSPTVYWCQQVDLLDYWSGRHTNTWGCSIRKKATVLLKSLFWAQTEKYPITVGKHKVPGSFKVTASFLQPRFYGLSWDNYWWCLFPNLTVEVWVYFSTNVISSPVFPDTSPHKDHHEFIDSINTGSAAPHLIKLKWNMHSWTICSRDLYKYPVICDI